MSPAVIPESKVPPSGAVAGMVVGGVLALGLLLLLIFWCHHRRKVRKDELDERASFKSGDLYRGRLPIPNVERRGQLIPPAPTIMRQHHQHRPPAIGVPQPHYGHGHPPPIIMHPVSPQPELLPHGHPLAQSTYMPMHIGGRTPPPPGLPMDESFWSDSASPDPHPQRHPYPIQMPPTMHHRHGNSEESETSEATTTSSMRVDTIEEVKTGHLYSTPTPIPQATPMPPLNYIPAGPGPGPARMQQQPFATRGPPIRQVPTMAYYPESFDGRGSMPPPISMFQPLRTVHEGGSDSNGGDSRLWAPV